MVTMGWNVGNPVRITVGRTRVGLRCGRLGTPMCTEVGVGGSAKGMGLSPDRASAMVPGTWNNAITDNPKMRIEINSLGLCPIASPVLFREVFGFGEKTAS